MHAGHVHVVAVGALGLIGQGVNPPAQEELAVLGSVWLPMSGRRDEVNSSPDRQRDTALTLPLCGLRRRDFHA